MSRTHKTYLIIALVVLTFLVVFGLYFYKRGKRTTTLQDPTKLPGDTSNGGEGTSNTGASNDDLKLLVAALHEDMDGPNLFGHDIEPYKRMLQLSDGDLIKLYNAFNATYQADSGETLYQWIENEKYSFYEMTDTILAKMQKLNLK